MKHPPAARLSASDIKYVAVAAMFIDHFANIFFPAYFQMPAYALHLIGRITGPVMFYFIAEGYRHTGDKNRYTLRLLGFAALSYLPFQLYRLAAGQQPPWYSMNVQYTLLLGLLALRARHELRSPLLRAGGICLCFLLSLVGDWGGMAILFILLFDRFAGDFAAQAKAYAAVCAALMFLPLLEVLLRPAWPPAALGETLSRAFAAALPQMGYYAAFFLPLGLLRFYGGERGRGGRWTFYVFYPAHLLFLALAGTLFPLDF